MRAILIAGVAAAAIALSSVSLIAAPTGVARAPNNATPLLHLAQGNYYGGYTYGFGLGTGYNYIPACPYNYHYDCWSDPYGYRHCGCLLNRW